MQIVYQPIVHLNTEAVVGYEALSRFPGGESPDEVFRTAWKHGHGIELEREAFSQAVREFPIEIEEAYLAINASAKTIINSKGSLVEDPGLEVPWPRIVIEVSEKAKIANYQLMDRPLAVLRQRQTRIAMDDVGTGHSGLGLLIQMNPDIIKVDRSLIDHLDQNPMKREVVRAIVGLARRWRSTVIAEGIETQKELTACQDLDVDCGQGYLLGEPKSFL